LAVPAEGVDFGPSDVADTIPAAVDPAPEPPERRPKILERYWERRQLYLFLEFRASLSVPGADEKTIDMLLEGLAVLARRGDEEQALRVDGQLFAEAFVKAVSEARNSEA
jgi:hypothetical protein